MALKGLTISPYCAEKIKLAIAYSFPIVNKLNENQQCIGHIISIYVPEA